MGTDPLVDKLSSIVRSVSDNREPTRTRDRDRELEREKEREREAQRERQREKAEGRAELPSPHYENFSNKTRSRQGSRTSSLNRESARDSTGPRQEGGHWRNNSASTGEFTDPTIVPQPVRRHDYDVQSMESELGPRNLMASPIPPPVVTVKSEFPTITRSKTQQSLTCLVTVEIPDRKSQVIYPDETIPSIPTLPATYGHSYHPSSPTNRSQYSFERDGAMTRQRDRDVEKESEMEALAAITDDLRMRVENWHGLDFGRYVYILTYLVSIY